VRHVQEGKRGNVSKTLENRILLESVRALLSLTVVPST